jgi:bacillithiol biosynthesis deacetylase BshB1
MKLDILAISVHPDDVEISCSGTLLHHIELGDKVGILDLTSGELGTRGSAELRLKESAAASELMNLHVRHRLQMEDGFFEYNKANLLEIIKVLRLYQPEIVLANSVRDRHPDHGRAAKLVADACFYSGLIKIGSELGGITQNAWRPKAVYHYIQDYNLKPDFVFDISQYMDKKLEVILAYKSQFYNPESNEPETAISSKEFLEYMRAKSCTLGREAGFHYAEGYTVNRNIGINNLFDLK